MSRVGFRIFGGLLVLPWLIVPRPAATPPPVSLGPAMAAVRDVDAADPSTSAGAQNTSQDDWRRTKRGWERRDRWRICDPSPQPSPIHRVHPWTIASLQALLCLAALLAADHDIRKKLRPDQQKNLRDS